MPDPKNGTAADIKQKFERGARDITRETAHYWLNTSFVEGEQYIAWNRRDNRLEQVPKPDNSRVRFTDNRVGPDSETILAKLLRRPLTFEVPPTAADDSAIEGAKVSGDVLADTHRAHNWEQLREEHAWAVWKGATAGLCVEWDPNAGRLAGTNAEGADVREGDIIETALTVCEMVTEPGARDIERARWWIKVAALPPGEVRERYGLDEDPPADFTGAMSPLQRQLMLGRSNSSTNELTQVLTYFERPNPATPQGRVAVVVGNKVVDEGTWPFPFTDRLNVTVATARPINGRWCGSCRLTDAIEVQTALNVVWSSVVEHRKLAGNARGIASDMAFDDIEYLSDMPEIVPVKTIPGAPFPPFQWVAPPSMTGHFEEIARLREEIDDLLGVHDVSRGEAPSNIASGVGLQILAEQDDTPIGSLSRKLGDCWGRFASLVLAILEQKVTAPRTGRVEFDGLPPFSFQWSGRDFAGQTVAIVPADVVSTESKAARFQRAVLMWDKGMFGTPGDPKLFARYCDLPGGSSLIEAMDPDETRAREENHRMSLGMPELPMEEDDHPTHIAIHLAYVKSSGFRLLPPETQQMVRDHIKAHEVLNAEELAKQQAKAKVSPVLASVASATGAPTPDFTQGADIPTAPEPAQEPQSDMGDAPMDQAGVPGA